MITDIDVNRESKSPIAKATENQNQPPPKNSLKVVLNPDFKQMNESDKRRTISVDKRFLQEGPNGRVKVLKHICDSYIKKSFAPSFKSNKD